ncbi:RNA polymerase subunit sigma-24 [Streptomyces incarnatus]|uniref:RNA polymerase subunit sigma-24 n=1 Tax=Streptomyces incarnatus TaxID=665007 RepID=A0ABM5TCR7_9ACTN|nr:sigma-70 family RNA polymerase sigma factor [Streptomyces incarnatus]AKJ08729.1 RNA polymerase subunit sigma-24 [Streptomyces incarnatus]
MSSADPAGARDTRSLIERVFREEAGRLTASLVRLLGDFDLAEEMVGEAVVEALRRWPDTGPPRRPGAWLLTCARNKALDRIRREARFQDRLPHLAARIEALPETAEREPDDRLRLIFTCCHPALDPDAQVALTLRAVVGLTTAEIARAFMVPEATLAKRVTRAKQKIAAAGIPYRAPEPEERAARLPQVMRVVYLVFNEGCFTTGGDLGVRRELVDDAEWLAALLAGALPQEPEPLALLALIRLHAARWPSRLDPGGRLVPLAEQDRTRWDTRRIRSATALIERAARFGMPGPYQIEAAIAAVHCEAPGWKETDWPQLLRLYDMLLAVDPSPVVRLNRAVVLSHTDGPATALAEVEALSGPLGRYHLFHATRAALLRDLGRDTEATEADRQALRLTTNPAERSLLTARLEP